MKVSATENITSNQLESFRKNGQFTESGNKIVLEYKIITKLNQ